MIREQELDLVFGHTQGRMEPWNHGWTDRSGSRNSYLDMTFFMFIQVKHKAREAGEPLPAGQLAATEAFLSAGGRRYRSVWETDFPWVRRAPGDSQSQNAYCTVCHEILLPKYNR